MLEHEKLSHDGAVRLKERVLATSFTSAAVIGAMAASLFLAVIVRDNFIVPLATLIGAGAILLVHLVSIRLRFRRSKRNSEVDE